MSSDGIDTHPHHSNTAPSRFNRSSYPQGANEQGQHSRSTTPPGHGTPLQVVDEKDSKDTVRSGDDSSRSILPEQERQEKVAQPEGARKRKKFLGILGQPDRTETDQDTHEDLARTDSQEKKKRLRKKIPVWTQVKATLFGSWINLLLIASPVGFAINYAHLDGIANFVVNFVAIIPLAAMLSFATEELAMYVGETLGGLLNASFGNATELIGTSRNIICFSSTAR